MLLTGCAAHLAWGSPENATNQARLDSTVRYLQSAQNIDGGFGASTGAPSDPDFSAWVTFALAADGINPQDQEQPGGTDAYTYLAEHSSSLEFTTDFERALLVVDASGASPHDFGGVDLLREILARQLSGAGKEGAFPHEAAGRTPGVNDTIFAILALGPIAEPAAQSAVKRASDWVIQAQDEDGGWPETVACANPSKACRSEVDMTGAAIQALNAAGRRSTEAQTRAFAYLHDAQDQNGGFPEHMGESEPNVASTAWAVQGMWSAGQNPETWAIGESGEEPLGYLASLQQPDGHIRWKAGQDLNGLWMTAEVAPAFAGQPLPPPSPARAAAKTPASSAQETTTSTGAEAQAGHGGESSGSGGGVIAGGGGTGAPLFSRPQPQSRGSTPGGVRLLDRSAAHKSAVKHRRDPGAPRKAPAPTIATAPTVASAGNRRNPGAGGTGAGRVSHAVQPRAGSGGEEIKGVLIATPTRSSEPGAPGLQGASAGGNRTPWLAIGIAGSILLLFLTGSQLERRRPQAIW
jgi:hypothetical protein